MYCMKCGAKLPNEAVFCMKCGEKIQNDDSNKYIKLICKNCGGSLEVDPSRTLISCPYCQSKTLIEESDNVKISKVKAKAYTKVNTKKYEAKKIKNQVEIEKAKYEYKLMTTLFGLIVILMLMLLIPGMLGYFN